VQTVRLAWTRQYGSHQRIRSRHRHRHCEAAHRTCDRLQVELLRMGAEGHEYRAELQWYTVNCASIESVLSTGPVARVASQNTTQPILFRDCCPTRQHRHYPRTLIIGVQPEHHSREENIMENVLALQSIKTAGPEPLAEMLGSAGSLGCDHPN